jgi:hypothetical protein
LSGGVSRLPNVLECFLVTGDWDYVLKVVVRDLDEYQKFLVTQLTFEARSLLAALREAFAAYSTSRTVDSMRIPVTLPAQQVPVGASGMLLGPGLVTGIPAYSVKVHTKFPGQDPAIRGVLILHDLCTGMPLAIMESSYLTRLRTGLVGALGADVLALPGARSVAVIDAGAQGRSQIEALRLVRPVTNVRVFDTVSLAAERMASDFACQGLTVTVCTSLEEVLEGAEIVVTARGHGSPSSSVDTFGLVCTSQLLAPMSPASVKLRLTRWRAPWWWWTIGALLLRWAH